MAKYMARVPRLMCDFCGKSETEAYLIAGPDDLAICEDCVGLCADLLARVERRTRKEEHSHDEA